MTTKARLTAQDLWKLGEGDTRRELVNGEIVEMSPVGGVHGDATGRVYRRLAEYAERRGGCKALVGDCGFFLDLALYLESVLAPVVAFVTTSRLPGVRLCSGFL